MSGACLIALLLLDAWSASVAACAGDPWLEIEVRAVEMAASQQVIESTTVDADGCVLSEFALFDIRAGRHKRQLSSGELQTLRSAIDASGVRNLDAQVVAEKLAAPPAGADDLGPEADDFVIIGGDVQRLVIVDGTQRTEIALRAAEQFAAERTDLAELQQFVGAVAALRAANADPRKPGVKELAR